MRKHAHTGSSLAEVHRAIAYSVYDFEYQKGDEGIRNKLCFFTWSACVNVLHGGAATHDEMVGTLTAPRSSRRWSTPAQR